MALFLLPMVFSIKLPRDLLVFFFAGSFLSVTFDTGVVVVVVVVIVVGVVGDRGGVTTDPGEDNFVLLDLHLMGSRDISDLVDPCNLGDIYCS